MHNTLEPYKPTLEDLIKTCPPLYPLNNDLRRNHKATIGKELRGKRDDERYDWWRKNKFEIFDATWDELNEYLAGNIENGFWDDITTIDDIIKGDKDIHGTTKF